MVRGDATLRNFLFTDRIWGVDFEEARKGEPIEDIAQMCASILSTDPMFTEKKIHLCQLFIHTYRQQAPWSLGNINDEVAYSLLQQIQWRPEQEEILRTNAIRLRKKQYLNLINGHNF